VPAGASTGDDDAHGVPAQWFDSRASASSIPTCTSDAIIADPP
jgi:hypothetical protein